MNKPYRDLNSYLRERFGERVQRVPIDAGCDCPNRDGTLGRGGCIYCSPTGSGAHHIARTLSVREQIEHGIESARQKYKADKFIAYFQAFTNTYPPRTEDEKMTIAIKREAVPTALQEKYTNQLAAIYQPALEHADVVGIAIGTRPDCLPDSVIELLVEMAQQKPVWLEIGLQSAHDETLRRIKRGHGYACFVDAVKRVRKQVKSIKYKQDADERAADQVSLEIVTHIIFGLPGETQEMMLETVREVARLVIEGIKIHLLHVIRDTALADMYERGEIDLLDQEIYVSLVSDALELLPPEMVIHRLTGEAGRDKLIAPIWALDKARTLQMIEEEMKRRGTRQGSKY